MENIAARVILLSGWRRAIAAMAAGALAVLTQAPYDFFPAGFVSFTLLVWLLDGATDTPSPSFVARLRPAFAVGWWFGFGYFVAGLWWIGQALLVDADNFAWALPIAVLGLPALLAFFYGAATALARLAWGDGIGRIAALAAGFGIAEWLRGFVLTGFPWNAIGQAVMPVPLLMQSIAVAGLAGMSALAVFVFAMPALAAAGRHRRLGLAAALLVATAHVGYGAWRLDVGDVDHGPAVDLRIVQPSISQAGKWDPAMRRRTLDLLLTLSARPPADGARPPRLIVWPETALPFVVTERPEVLSAIGDMLGEGQTLFLGAVRSEAPAAEGQPPRYYNSIVAIDDTGAIVDAADKLHLVPFGEYLPLGGVLERFGLETIAETVGGFTPGLARRALRVADGVRALPLICYEIIFPGAAEPGDTGANLILNVTNDAWYGDTPGPYQHFRQARLRAVEAGLPLVRAANNGISAVVDGKGRILDALALDSVGTLDITLPIPGRVRPSWISPALNSFLILLFFATLACGMNAAQRLRSR